MKKSAMRKILSLCLCAVFLFGCTGSAIYALAANSDNDDTAPPASTTAAAVSQETGSAIKDETVYVLAGADGCVEKIIVSDWIQNTLGSATLNDKSELTNVENVKGNESYTIGSDNMRIWDTQGNDIYYQGNIEKELPVSLSVTYLLDGKTVSPDELAGKSGRVTIRFDYTNNQYEYVEIDGKKEKIYVPFAMLTGMLLDNATFTNVEVSNGKRINDGDRTAIIGIAFPGLQENLALEKEDFDIPDYVEITADVTNFELGTTITVATNELFSELDLEGLDSIDDLRESLGEMTDAMDQLLDGSSQLYDGLCTLLDNSDVLVKGIDKLAAGAKDLKNGIGTLDSGVSQLQNGASALYSGLNTLSSNSGELNAGAKQVFETLLSTANTQLASAGLSVPTMTISNYASVLNGVIASLDESAVYEQVLAMVTAAVEEQRSYIESQVTAAVQEEITAKVTAAVQEQVTAQVTAAVHESVAEQVIQTVTGMDKASYDSAVEAGLVEEEIQAAIENAINEQMESETVKAVISSNVEAQMASEEVQTMIAENVAAQLQSDTVKELIAANTEMQVEKAISDNMASDEVQAKLTAASEGAQSVIALKASLDSYNAFYLGLQAYTAGVAEAAAGAGSLKSGADELKEGTGQLYAGASELYHGILTLKDGAPALVDGVTQLRDGAMRLSDGLKEFNEEGIQKLVEAFDGDLDGLVTRIRAICDVSKHYQSFSGISDEMDGQVKFVYRIASIE